MPTSEELTDSYLAALLSKEADDFANGRSRGPSRPRDAPKPNLRFLRNIIKDTDSHNSALIERERRSAERGTRSAYENARRPKVADDQAVKRRRTERSGRWSAALDPAGLRSGEHNERRKYNRERSRSRDRDAASRQRRRDQRHRPRSPIDSHKGSRHKGHRSRSRSPSLGKDADSERHSSKNIAQDDSDTDPLEAIVGPRPPSASKARGRGATAESSGFDSRFKDPNYNPREDTREDLDDEDDEWEMALSAMRERMKRRPVAADRLRAAGFDEADVQKWERQSNKLPTPQNIDEDVDNVVWKKRGEARDWDQGKTMDADGDVVVKPAWTDLQ